MTYDGSGNLNVAVAAGSSEATQLTDFGFQLLDHTIFAGSSNDFGLGGTQAITSVSVWASGSLWLQLESPSDTTFGVRVGPGETITETFPFPIEADAISMMSLSGVDHQVSVVVSGYTP